jgi:hypothetical protein
MIYYMVRHKATGEFMPELKRTRGYSHWNPSKVDTVEHLGKKILGVPRLFPSRRKAHFSIVQWNACPNSYARGKQSWDGDYDEDININPDGRTKDDLEIVEVNIEEVPF